MRTDAKAAASSAAPRGRRRDELAKRRGGERGGQAECRAPIFTVDVAHQLVDVARVALRRELERVVKGHVGPPGEELGEPKKRRAAAGRASNAGE